MTAEDEWKLLLDRLCPKRSLVRGVRHAPRRPKAGRGFAHAFPFRDLSALRSKER
jgi:hypothetical protein